MVHYKPRYNKHNSSDEPRGDMDKYLVVPDYWKSKWGPRPVLGIVYASNVFEGERQAYDKGLLRVNFTFKPKLILARPPGEKSEKAKNTHTKPG